MVRNPKAKENRQAVHIFGGEIFGDGMIKEHYQWFGSDLSIRMAAATKVDFEEIAFATADLRSGLH